MKDVKVCDINVQFPFDPYPSQLSIINKIIRALNEGQNCLLESPTGTGKTLALLCSALAWIENKKCNENSTPSRIDNIKEHLVESDEEFDLELVDSYDDFENPEKVKKLENRTKIFYCSRTHRQIGQLVRELKRTHYAYMPMSILSSRKHSCLNSHVLQSKDVNEECKSLCDSSKGCLFRKNVGCQPIPDGPWDLESQKPILIREKCCLHYQARSWASEANIIFCPYNYILDAKIRNALQISLKNSIVILDEAHNIESVCQESSSWACSLKEFNIFKLLLIRISKETEFRVNGLTNMIDNIVKLINDLSSRLSISYSNILNSSWKSTDVISIMNLNKITWESVQGWKNDLRSFVSDLNIALKKREITVRLNDTCKQKLSRFLYIAGLLLIEDSEYLDDFRFVVSEGEEFYESSNSENSDSFLNAFKRKTKAASRNFILDIICLNPSIAFSPLVKRCRSIILTSGTLAPQISFDKELACQFKYTLEAYHIVKSTQTFMASVGYGPSGIPLNATYHNTELLSFQDELGRLLKRCCEIVPYGVLCFVSSFQMIDKLMIQWKSSNLIDEIKKYKTIIIEPRNSSEMDIAMKEYYRYLNDGVLLLAVFRGKASEGIDFADNAARLVIAVGIPYPSISSPQVILKRNYNDKKYKEAIDKNGCLSGSEWYRVQAFRALNQALGRCIRHRDDWGAVILVDNRFGETFKNCASDGICKWIRSRNKYYEKTSHMFEMLKDFVLKHITEDKLSETGILLD